MRNKVLLNYCENAAYYNTTPSASKKEGKKKNNTYINKSNIQTIQNKTELTHPPCRSLV